MCGPAQMPSHCLPPALPAPPPTPLDLASAPGDGKMEELLQDAAAGANLLKALVRVVSPDQCITRKSCVDVISSV